MAKVKIFNVLSNLTKFEDFSRFASALFTDIVQKFNGDISFVENIRATGAGDKLNPSEPLSVTFASSSEVQTVNHTLGFVPNGFLIVNMTAAASIYAPSGTGNEWTSSAIYLKSSAAVTAKIYII